MVVYDVKLYTQNAKIHTDNANIYTNNTEIHTNNSEICFTTDKIGINSAEIHVCNGKICINIGYSFNSFSTSIFKVGRWLIITLHIFSGSLRKYS